MSEIRNIPDVKDASGIFKFDAGKKAIIVREWRNEMRKDPLVIQAAKSEAPPMDWRELDLRYDPDLTKELL